MTHWIAGVDEVGRGSLAGPVIAAAVILAPDDRLIAGLNDSKRLSPQQRERLAGEIHLRARAWSIGRAEVSEIDRLNILQASLLAMRRALAALPVQPDWIRVDGKQFPADDRAGEAVVQGDSIHPEIMAASILAKVWRDREMALVDVLYPGYDFGAHKGYPTQRHRDRLKCRGASPAHRRSFGPVARCV